MVSILVEEWNMESQNLAGVATERREGQHKELLWVNWQQKEDKGTCGPAAELGDWTDIKVKEKEKTFSILDFAGKKPFHIS